MKIKELTLEQAKLLCDKYRKICNKCPYNDSGYCKLSTSNLNHYGNHKVRKKDMELLNARNRV